MISKIKGSTTRRACITVRHDITTPQIDKQRTIISNLSIVGEMLQIRFTFV